jgi:hypothetical protein
MTRELHELIADKIRDYSPISINLLREWELMARDAFESLRGKVIIDQSTYEEMMTKLDNIDAGIKNFEDGANQFDEFLKWHLGADFYHKLILKYNEWLVKQEAKKNG